MPLKSEQDGGLSSFYSKERDWMVLLDLKDAYFRISINLPGYNKAMPSFGGGFGVFSLDLVCIVS